MGGGPYSTEKEGFDKNLDLTRIKPYGDTMNDGKVQLSFTLPIEHDEKAIEAAKELAEKMGLKDPEVAYHTALDKGFTYFVVYGNSIHTIDYTKIKVETVEVDVMTKDEINNYIREKIGCKLVILGASTGTDAHTVGIDAIINMKGFAGHYGLEHYEMIEAFNLGSQVTNEEFVKKAIQLKADVLLVSQTVTQKDIHVKNLTQLVDLLEAEGIRDQIILICGGARINNELAKELGYDAGFGPGTYAEIVASFFIRELVNRKSV
ncbi:MAG: cobalamin B12-binding domain-containing protein [Candidatus Lokiarchaeota archaeon]|nr:cobalamin B12-binding domain-containing protein [Candidatus Lokiarchaeota archaeon]